MTPNFLQTKQKNDYAFSSVSKSRYLLRVRLILHLVDTPTKSYRTEDRTIRLQTEIKIMLDLHFQGNFQKIPRAPELLANGIPQRSITAIPYFRNYEADCRELPLNSLEIIDRRFVEGVQIRVLTRKRRFSRNGPKNLLSSTSRMRQYSASEEKSLKYRELFIPYSYSLPF